MAIRSLKTGTFTRSGMAGNPVIMPGSYESIASAAGDGASGTITFSSIPSTYTHLQIRCIANASNNGAQLGLRFNGDSAGNYARHRLIGDGTTASAVGTTSNNQIPVLANAGLPTVSNTYGVFVWDILDYANTNKYKTVRVLSGQDSNGSGGVDFTSGLWLSTSAVTSITLLTSAGNLTTASSFALYGVN